MKNIICSFAFLFPMLFAFTPAMPETTCPEPANVHKTFQSSGSISFDWDDCGCGGVYKVKYQRKSDGFTSAEVTVTTSNHTFSGLSAGVYSFLFRTDCGTEVSDAIVVEDLGVN